MIIKGHNRELVEVQAKTWIGYSTGLPDCVKAV